MEYSIYINIEDLSRAREEECNQFIRSVLENIRLDIDDVWPEGLVNISPDDKIKIWKFLDKFGIDIIHDGDYGYKIYFEDSVIGEWYKPKIVLRKDTKARKLSKALYYELQLKYSSVFEEKE